LFRSAILDRYRVAVDLGSGCGLRQGEIFGASPDDLDRERRVLHVVRQVKIVGGQLVFAPLKVGKLREVPLPDVVAGCLDAHARSSRPFRSPCPG
jgi:integrase